MLKKSMNLNDCTFSYDKWNLSYTIRNYDNEKLKLSTFNLFQNEKPDRAAGQDRNCTTEEGRLGHWEEKQGCWGQIFDLG